MKKIITKSLKIFTLYVFLSSSSALADIGSSLQLKERFMQSVVPIETVVPPIKEISDPYSLYENEFKSKQEKLLVLFNPNKSQSPFEIKKYASAPEIFVGYPSYLSPKIAPPLEGVQKATDNLKDSLSQFFEINKMENIKLSNNDQSANLFLLPVTTETYIEISNSNVKVSPLRRANYENILIGLKRVFFNQNIYQLNSAGLKGTFLNDTEGNIIVSYCPVDIQKGEKAIADNIFYCIIQSQGLPGFFSRYPKLDEDARSWSKKLTTIIGCNEVKPQQNVFDLDFEKTSSQCLTTGE